MRPIHISEIDAVEVFPTVDMFHVHTRDIHTNSLTEKDRLGFARQILLCLALICIGEFIAYGVYPENGAITEIFELVKIGALPVVTLVISFYFPNTFKHNL